MGTALYTTKSGRRTIHSALVGAIKSPRAHLALDMSSDQQIRKRFDHSKAIEQQGAAFLLSGEVLDRSSGPPAHMRLVGSQESHQPRQTSLFIFRGHMRRGLLFQLISLLSLLLMLLPERSWPVTLTITRVYRDQPSGRDTSSAKNSSLTPSSTFLLLLLYLNLSTGSPLPELFRCFEHPC